MIKNKMEKYGAFGDGWIGDVKERSVRVLVSIQYSDHIFEGAARKGIVIERGLLIDTVGKAERRGNSNECLRKPILGRLRRL